MGLYADSAERFAAMYTSNTQINLIGYTSFQELSAMMVMMGFEMTPMKAAYIIMTQDHFDSNDIIPQEVYQRYPSLRKNVDEHSPQKSADGNGQLAILER